MNTVTVDISLGEIFAKKVYRFVDFHDSSADSALMSLGVIFAR